MGEAKRRKRLEELAEASSSPMKRARFNLYTMGTRLSRTAYMCEEVSWWCSHDEALLGMVARDTMVLSRFGAAPLIA